MNGIGMQDKTIRKNLSKKLNDWISSIEDQQVRQLVEKNVIVTGGSIASMIMGDRVNDYDIYLKTKEATIALARYYSTKFNELNPGSPLVEVKEVTLKNIKGESEERVVNWITSSGVVKDEDFQTDEDMDDENDPDYNKNEEELEAKKGKYVPVFISENAITLSGKIQVVTRFYGEPEKIHSNYDYVHAKCYYDYYKNELVIPLESVRSMQSKTLRYTGSLYPVCSLFRLRKFISRGWKISAGDILKISMQISNIDLTDPRILRESLVGVDALYFHMLIEALEKAPESSKDENGAYNTSYVVELIDRIFTND